MKRYPKLKRLGHQSNDGILSRGTVVVREKLDGANFRFCHGRHVDGVADDRIVFGSRNVVYKNERDTDSNFEHAVEYVRDRVTAEGLRGLEDDVADGGPFVFFGEAMHPHTLDYDWETTPNVVGFDVWDAGRETWCDPEPGGLMERLFTRLDLPTAPIVYRGPAEDWSVNDMEGRDSAYRDGSPEGYVIRNVDTGQRAKWRTEQFREAHDVSASDDPVDDDAVSLARQFATEARVLKHIHKYEDEGRTIEMALMEDLWRRVFDDIIEEEYDTIFLGNHTIDTKRFRSEVASRCANVLQTYLQRPDDSVLNEA